MILGHRSMSHLNRCVMKNSLRDSIHPTYSLRVSMKVLFWTYSKYSRVYLESTPSPNFNELIFHINLKRTKRKLQNIHSKHMQVHWLSFDSILRHWLFSCYIYIVSQHCAFVHSFCILSSTVVYGWISKS